MRFIHDAVSTNSLFPFLLLNTIPLYDYISIIHSPVYRKLGYFQCGTLLSHTAMNIHLQVWMEMLSFLLGIRRREKIDCERKKGERNIYMEVLSKVKWSTILCVDFSGAGWTLKWGHWVSLKLLQLHNTVFQLVCGENGEIHLDVAAAGKNDLTPMWKAMFPSIFIATKRTMYWKLNITRFSFQFNIKCAYL